LAMLSHRNCVSRRSGCALMSLRIRAAGEACGN
jgi:hypothetical protein